MTPEERFRRLRDETLWNEVRIPRGRTAPRARRPLAFRLSLEVLAGAVIAAVVISGITVWRNAVDPNPAIVRPLPSPTRSIVPSPTETPSPTPTATPTATSTAPPTNAAPAQLFGGKCTSVLPDAKVDRISKTAMSSDPAVLSEVMGDYDGELTGARGFVTREIGGLNCAWFSEKKGTLISITFAPADRVAKLTKAQQCSRELTGWSGCYTDLVENGVRVSAQVGQTGGPEDARITRELLAVIKPAIATLDHVSGHTPSAQDWPFPVDCAALGKESGLGSVLTPGEADQSGMYAELLGRSGSLSCAYEGGSAQYRPGGAWAEPRIASTTGAKKLDVTGFDHVIRVSTDGQYTYHFFRGTNWLIVNEPSRSQASIIRFATKAADGLDRL